METQIIDYTSKLDDLIDLISFQNELLSSILLAICFFGTGFAIMYLLHTLLDF